jgi:Tfp pilus assembly protein PilZ
MTENRRRHRRFAGPYDGSWDGLAGASGCRITDLSAGGCFIDSVVRQEMGGEVTVTVVVAGQSLTLSGKVVYLDRVQGFGVQFTESDATRQLAAVLDAQPS